MLNFLSFLVLLYVSGDFKQKKISKFFFRLIFLISTRDNAKLNRLKNAMLIDEFLGKNHLEFGENFPLELSWSGKKPTGLVDV